MNNEKETTNLPTTVPELEKKEPTLSKPLETLEQMQNHPSHPANKELPTTPIPEKSQTAPQTEEQPPKEPVKLTVIKNELIGVLEYAETLSMIQIRSSNHPGIAWAGGKLLDHLTEAKHWVYEMQLLPPMPKQSPIVTPRDFLKKKQ